MPRLRKPASPFRYFNSSPEVIRRWGLVVLAGAAALVFAAVAAVSVAVFMGGTPIRSSASRRSHRTQPRTRLSSGQAVPAQAPRLDRAAHALGWKGLHAASFFLSPKNAGPDQWVPVIAFAI